VDLVDFALGGRLLRQPETGSVLVIVANVVGHQALQMTFIQHNHMIKQVATAISNESLGYSILPGTSNCRRDRDNSETLDCVQNLARKVCSRSRT